MCSQHQFLYGAHFSTCYKSSRDHILLHVYSLILHFNIFILSTKFICEKFHGKLLNLETESEICQSIIQCESHKLNDKYRVDIPDWIYLKFNFKCATKRVTHIPFI